MAFETRIKTTLFVLLVLSTILTSLRMAVGALRLGMDPALDEVSHYEKRLEPLRKALPQRAIVGYVTDATDGAEISRRFHMTRYALSPVIVVRGAGGQLVVGDFTSAAAASRHFGAGQVRQDFGNGLVLLVTDK